MMPSSYSSWRSTLAASGDRIALRRAAIDQLAQIRLPRLAFVDGEERKLSGQAFQTETAALRDGDAAFDRFGMRGEEPPHRSRPI